MALDYDTTSAAAVHEVLLNDPAFLQELVRGVLQRFLEAEMDDHLQAGRYERSEERRGHRNGYKDRQVGTRVGNLRLLVPQDREGTFKTELFERYQRSEKALVLSLMDMYLQGVSTRKVKEVTETLCGTRFRKSQVSRLAGKLDEELAAWRERPLEMAYPYLMVDARYEHVRVGKRVVPQGVLIVSGVRGDGYREILAVDVVDTESEA
jgi:putative transposase